MVTKNIFKEFNEDFFFSVNTITWYDKEGVMELDENRKVIFELEDIGTRDHYNGYSVKIYHKNNGLIVEKFFRFQFSEMEFIHRDTQKYYHVWYNSGKLDWYISRPKSSTPMVKEIMGFLEKWK